MFRLNGFWTWTSGAAPPVALPKMIMAGLEISPRMGGSPEVDVRLAGSPDLHPAMTGDAGLVN